MNDKLYNNFKTIKRGKNIYISREDAEKFIKYCSKNNIGISGFEGLYCEKNLTQASLDLIADFSKLFQETLSFKGSQKESCKIAMNIIQGFPTDKTLYIDFTLKEKS